MLRTRDEIIAELKRSNAEIKEGVSDGKTNSVRVLSDKERDARIAEWADSKLREEAAEVEKAARVTAVTAALLKAGITLADLREALAEGGPSRKIGG